MPEEIELHTDTIIEPAIAIDSLASLYPYIIVSPEDSVAVSSSGSEHSDDWQHLSGLDTQPFSQPTAGKAYSIREMYPGQEGTPIHRGIQTEVWFAPLLFLLFVAYGLIFFRKKKTLFQDFKGLFSFSFKIDASKKEPLTDSYRSRVLLTTAGIVNISLFAFFAVSRLFHHEAGNFILIFTLLLVVTTAYLWFKIAMIRLICYVFFDKKYSFIWRKTFYLLIRFLGILLIPVVLLLAFGSDAWAMPVVYAGLFSGIFLLFLYISKITAFFFQDVFSLFYLILYLCTLEILPVLIFLNELINVVTMV